MHLSDLHLGWEPKYLPDEKRKIRRKERDQLLQKAVDYALAPESNLQGMLIVGDLFEKYQPEATLVRETLRQLSRLTGQGMLVVTIPGNHDEITYRESVYRRQSADWPGFLVTNPMPAHCLSHRVQDTLVHVYSLAYTGGLTKTADLVYPRLDEPGFHIGAFHGSLDWEGLGDRSLPLTTAKLTGARYNYIALGHYHQFSSRPIGSGIAVYSGAVEFKSFSDPGSGHFTVVGWDGAKVTLEKPPAALRPRQSLSLDTAMFNDHNELKAHCLSYSDPQKMLRLTLTGTPRFHIREERLLEDLEEAFFYLELSNAAQYFSDHFLDAIAGEPTIRGLFVKRIRKRLETTSDDLEKKVLEQAMLQGLAALEGRAG
ncbi:MAG: metallophosphoesterase [Desulfotomaculaceae bacterium]|nr:metallophosphoesterase [Desulfotomaculaceae bacterium]